MRTEVRRIQSLYRRIRVKLVVVKYDPMTRRKHRFLPTTNQKVRKVIDVTHREHGGTHADFDEDEDLRRNIPRLM